ncbi:MAG TPA: flap endonuclease, partial [Ilumatobacteraceae bacterium]|nr:flap endonuclease [Ilumatobacteraceae bacterium]
EWAPVGVRGAAKLAGTLAEQFDLALLFRRIATVVTDLDVGAVHEWRWTGPTGEFAAIASRLGAAYLVARAESIAARR